MRNRKTDNSKFEIHGNYLHMYGTLEEIENDGQIEYEGELYVLKTDLTEEVIKQNYETMLLFLQKVHEQGRTCAHTKDLARTYLECTDYLARKCIENNLVFSEAYPEVKALSDKARDVVREGWE